MYLNDIVYIYTHTKGWMLSVNGLREWYQKTESAVCVNHRKHSFIRQSDADLIRINSVGPPGYRAI